MHDKSQIIPIILQSLRGGNSEPAAAEAAGIDFTTLWRWKNEDPDFAAKVEDAKRVRIPKLEDALYLEGLKGNPRAAIPWLKKHDKGWRNLDKDGGNQERPGNDQGHVYSAQDPEKYKDLTLRQLLDLLTPEEQQKFVDCLDRMEEIVSPAYDEDNKLKPSAQAVLKLLLIAQGLYSMPETKMSLPAPDEHVEDDPQIEKDHGQGH